MRNRSDIEHEGAKHEHEAHHQHHTAHTHSADDARRQIEAFRKPAQDTSPLLQRAVAARAFLTAAGQDASQAGRAIEWDARVWAITSPTR